MYQKDDSDFGTIRFSKSKIEAGTITASVSGQLDSSLSKAMLFVAVVDRESGKTVSEGVTAINYSDSFNTYSAPAVAPDDYEKYEVRVFLWNGSQSQISGKTRLGL